MHVSIREMQENLWKTWQKTENMQMVVFMDPPRTGSDKKVYVLCYQTESIKNRIYLLWTGNTGKRSGVFDKTWL